MKQKEGHLSRTHFPRLLLAALRASQGVGWQAWHFFVGVRPRDASVSIDSEQAFCLKVGKHCKRQSEGFPKNTAARSSQIPHFRLPHLLGRLPSPSPHAESFIMIKFLCAPSPPRNLPVQSHFCGSHVLNWTSWQQLWPGPIKTRRHRPNTDD